ncbi:MAG TPA: nuclear transport factor 2 family protein [Beijerinckiaceae bacterium]|jgi:ketosteroid isomerase-like protein
MMDRAAALSMLKEAYGARVAGDVEGTVRHFTDDATFALAGAREASPVAVRCTGCEPLRAVMGGLIDAFQFSDHEILDLFLDGPKAAVHTRFRVRSAATGEEAVTETVDLITFEGDKIAAYTQFCDTALAAKLAGPAAA